MTAPPRRPRQRLPALARGSARRLVRLDVSRSAAHGGVVVDADATDLLGTAGPPRRLAQARLRAEVDERGRVVALRSWPALAGDPLLGVPVVGGLRAAARRLLRTPPEGPTPLAALLDDVPVAVLVSGYLAARTGPVPADAGLLRDVCAGWSRDGGPLARLARTGTVPVSDLAPVEDARLGQDLPPLAPDTLRRLRWVTVLPGDDAGAARSWDVAAGFRDSCRSGQDPEGVLHEYDLTARLDEGGVLTHLHAAPRVLPFSTCPAAVAEVPALDGSLAGELPRRVPRVLPGARGCTHLNDLLRALACAPRLRSSLAPAA